MTPSSTVQVWAFVFDQADGYAREDTANVAWRTAAVKLDDGKLRVFLSHDSLRIHFLELEFGTAFPRSTSGVQTVSEGNHRLKLLTSADIGVRVSVAWLEHKGRFLSTNRDAESLQAHHAVHVVW